MTAIVCPSSHGDLSESRVTFFRVLRSEWIKLRSLRSTWYTLAAAVALTIGVAVVESKTAGDSWQRLTLEERAYFDPTDASLQGVILAQFAIGVLGVLLATSEYSSRSIRASLVAVPSRFPIVLAKAAVLSAVTLVLMTPASVAAFRCGQAVLAKQHLGTDLGAPGVARAVVGAGLYFAVIGLFGLGLGFILRNTAGAISALFCLLLVVPMAVEMLGTSPMNRILPYLPTTAGQSMMSVNPASHHLGPWAGLLLCLGYAAGLLCLGTFRLTSHDA